jgi:hypothetical protein
MFGIAGTNRLHLTFGHFASVQKLAAGAFIDKLYK